MCTLFIFFSNIPFLEMYLHCYQRFTFRVMKDYQDYSMGHSSPTDTPYLCWAPSSMVISSPTKRNYSLLLFPGILSLSWLHTIFFQAFFVFLCFSFSALEGYLVSRILFPSERIDDSKIRTFSDLLFCLTYFKWSKCSWVHWLFPYMNVYKLMLVKL